MLSDSMNFIKAFYNEGEDFFVYMMEDKGYEDIKMLEELAELITGQGDNVKAREYYDRVLELKEEFRGIGNCYINRPEKGIYLVNRTNYEDFQKSYDFILNDINRMRIAPCLYINKGFHQENLKGTSIILDRVCDRDINKINAHFLEFDSIDSKEEQLKIFGAFPIRPSMLVESKRSIHAYYLMKPLEDCVENKLAVKRFKGIQMAIRSKIFDMYGAESDPAISNPSRAMRMPGFNHTKADTPYYVTTRGEIDYNLRYTQREICEGFGIDIDNIDLQDMTLYKNAYTANANGIIDLVGKHLKADGKLGVAYEHKITCKCYLHSPDNKPSAFISFEYMKYFCSACHETGQGIPLIEFAEEQGWDDIVEAIKQSYSKRIKGISIDEFIRKHNINKI